MIIHLLGADETPGLYPIGVYQRQNSAKRGNRVVLATNRPGRLVWSLLLSTDSHRFGKPRRRALPVNASA
jgi:hypothetical protein